MRLCYCVSMTAPVGLNEPLQVLREVFRTLPLGAALFDRDMRYLAHNEAWLPVHGEPAGRDLVGQLHYDVLPIRDEWRAIHRRCLDGGTEERGDDFFERPDGRREHLRWKVTPWRTSDGQIAGVIIYAERTTDQVETQRRLEERESMIRDLFEKSPVGLNLCTMDGLWIESNPAFLDIIGYTQQEADGGLTYWQLTPRRYDADELVQLEHLRTRGRYGPYEKEFIRKDGSLIPVRLNGFLVEREGKAYIWSLIEDLTAQRALEARLEEERIKAIHASKLAMMGEMAASFAHEINNPLEIIDAFAFTLKDAVAAGDAAYVDEALTAIREAVMRAGKIVHGLRKFARQRDETETTSIAVASIIDDAMDLCRARIRTHGVELELALETTARVRGHAIELAQVLVNLLNNAFDAVSEAPRKWIRMSAIDRPDVVVVSVEDSGDGVPTDLDEVVFRPFFTTKPVGSGTGLGLSISRSIIEDHGGTLTLDRSAPHTRFVIELPR